jgi:hypothetical protein
MTRVNDLKAAETGPTCSLVGPCSLCLWWAGLALEYKPISALHLHTITGHGPWARAGCLCSLLLDSQFH